jgi:hypothetical protein
MLVGVNMPALPESIPIPIPILMSILWKIKARMCGESSKG